MIEYIRRSLAEEAIEEYICRRCEEYNELAGGCISHAMHCPYLSGEEILKSVESEDVQPVKHGRWIGIDYDTYFECSECKHMTDWQHYNYCPYCGASMDKS